MPIKNPSEQPPCVSEQASVWFARLQADEVTAEEQARFKSWYRASREHARAYDRMRALWEMLEAPAQRVQAKVEAEQAPEAPSLASKGPYSRRFMGASSLILGVAVLLSNQLSILYQNLQSDYHTAPGERLTVALDDGSRVTLNTDTALNVDFSAAQRRIELLRGEGYFDVAPNKSRPFIVTNGTASARAVGTAFSVRDSADAVRVIVSEGTVEVSANNVHQAVLVHLNQQVSYQQGRIGPVKPANILEALAWQRGQLIFNRQPLSTVVDEVNRYRRGQILLINPELKERIVSGVFDTTEPDTAVDGIKATLKINSLNLSERLVLLY
jgi:transmembrane sensor